MFCFTPGEEEDAKVIDSGANTTKKSDHDRVEMLRGIDEDDGGDGRRQPTAIHEPSYKHPRIAESVHYTQKSMEGREDYERYRHRNADRKDYKRPPMVMQETTIHIVKCIMRGNVTTKPHRKEHEGFQLGGVQHCTSTYLRSLPDS